MQFRINLLPHRAARRELQKRLFFAGIGLAVLGAVVVVALGWLALEAAIGVQTARNEVIAAENRKMDAQIREIASLRQEIDALRARQKAVEDLQADRSQPVILFDQLNTRTPEGIFLRSVKQEGNRVSVAGLATSSERISEFMRSLQSGGQGVALPELVETKLSTQVAPGSQRRLLEFALTFQINTPPAEDAAGGARPGRAPGSAPRAAAGGARDG